MDIQKDYEGETVIFRLNGRIDAASVQAFESDILEVVKNGLNKVILDMKEITFMGSSGSRMLLKFYKQFRQKGGFLKVSNPSKFVSMTLRLSGLDAFVSA